jgi:two-component system, cell cycle sensor histidine kinase and response regulator CckA
MAPRPVQDLEDFRDFVENAADLIQSVRPDGSLLYVNSAWLQTLDYTRRNIRRLTVLDVVAPTARADWEKHFLRALAGESIENVETVLLGKNGQRIPVEGNVKPRFRHGKPVSVQMILRKTRKAKSFTTPTRRAATSPQHMSEERFRALVEMSSDAIVLINEQSQILYSSPSVERVMGYSALELLGRPGLELVHPDDQAAAVTVLQQAVEAPSEHVRFLIRVRHKDGSWRWLEGIGTNYLSEPAVRAIVVNYRDVTEQKRTEEALRASESKYRSIFDNAVEGLFQTTPEGQFLTLNPALARIYGYETPVEVIQHFQDVGRQLYVDPNRRLEFIRQIESLGKVQAFEFQIRRKDGSLAWVSESTRAVRDAAGHLLHYEGTVEDITERKRTEEELRLQRETLQKIFDHIPVMISFFDRGGQFQLVNRHWEKVMGWTLEEARSRDLLSICYPDPDYLQHVLNYILNPPAGFSDFKVRVRDGRTIDTSWANVLLSDGTSIGIGLDIRERKRAEEALRASEENWRTLAANVPDFICLLDRQGTIQFMNRILPGYEYAKVIGSSGYEYIAPEFHAQLREGMRRLFDEGEAFEIEYLGAGKPGETRWYVARHSPVRRDGEVVAALNIGTDITERKLAEEERRRLEARLQQAQRLESLGVLAGGIAHDFNNLLTAMLGFASLATMRLPDGSPVRPMLREIETAAQRAAELTQQMLAYSGRGKFVIDVVKVNKLVHEMAKLLQTVLSKKAVLQLNLEPATIEADAAQIRQVVMNLITNASDALEGQCGVISVRTGSLQANVEFLRSPFLPEELPAGEYAYIEVEDTGCGMSPETQARVFEPFFTTKFAGRGLGLAAVLGIVRGHRGTIKVKSAPGAGTLFQILLPCGTRVPAGDRASEDELRRLRGHGTVLIIEDESSPRNFARLALEEVGFETRTASDGRAGLTILRQHRGGIAAVLLDLTMPQMDGTEVLREIRQLEPDMPVLVMSGYSESELSSRFEGMGASGFIQKPFEPRELATRFHKLLSGSDWKI